MELQKVKELILQLELQKEQQELRDLGLTDIEIEGYIEYYWDTWFGTEKGDN
jgi:hypothetical protein